MESIKNKIPEAGDFMEELMDGQAYKVPHNNDRSGIAYPDWLVESALKKYAEMHVKAALESAEKSNFIEAKGISISPKSNNLHWTAYGSIGEIVYNPTAILNAYPLTNIK